MTQDDIIYTIKGNRKMYNKIAKHLLLSDLNEDVNKDDKKEKYKGSK